MGRSEAATTPKVLSLSSLGHTAREPASESKLQKVSWPVVLSWGGACDEAGAGPQVGVVRTMHSFNKHLLILVL